MVSNKWYQTNGTKQMVPNKWYQTNGIKQMVSNKWYSINDPYTGYYILCH